MSSANWTQMTCGRDAQNTAADAGMEHAPVHHMGKRGPDNREKRVVAQGQRRQQVPGLRGDRPAQSTPLTSVP